MAKVRTLLKTGLLGLLIGCKAAERIAPVSVTNISLNITTATLEFGQTIQLTAIVAGSDGSSLSNRPITWTSSNDAIATISSSGLATAGAVRGGIAESVTITATCDGKSASATLNVSPIPVSSIRLSASQQSLYVGQTAQLAAVLRDSMGAALTGRTVSWSSSAGSIAIVNDVGRVTAIAPGSTTVSASAEGKSAAVTVSVSLVPVQSVTISPSIGNLHVGQTLQLSTTARDSAGNPLTGRATSWATSATAVASVSSQGMVTAVAPGTAVISVTIEGKSASSQLTVTPIPISSISVSTPVATVAKSDTVRLIATARGPNNEVLMDRTIQWSVDDTTLASVTGSGLVTAKKSFGSFVVRASSEGVSGSRALTATCFRQQVVSSEITFSGTLDSSDCPSGTPGLFYDLFRFSLSSTRFVTFNIANLTGPARLITSMFQDSTIGHWVWDYANGGSGASWFLYGTGNWITSLRTQTVGASLSYSLRITTGTALSTGCGFIGTAIGSGLSITRTLNECYSDSRWSHQYSTYLYAGQTVTIAMGSADIDTYLCLAAETSETWTHCNDNASTSDSNSRLSFAATTSGYYDILTTSRGPNDSGTYTLTMSTLPVSLRALPEYQMETRLRYRLPARRSPPKLIGLEDERR